MYISFVAIEASYCRITIHLVPPRLLLRRNWQKKRITIWVQLFSRWSQYHVLVIYVYEPGAEVEKSFIWGIVILQKTRDRLFVKNRGAYLKLDQYFTWNFEKS